MKTKIVILSIYFITVLINAGEALQCYQCEGDPDSDCAKGVISSMEVVDCPNKNSFAMCRHTDRRNGDMRKFSRGCTTYSNPGLCTILYRLSARNPTALKVFSCNTCWAPKCNILTTK